MEGNTNALGYRHSPEAKKKMVELKKGKAPSEECQAASIKATTKPIIIDGIFYSSAKEAAPIFGLSPITIRKRASSSDEKYANWRYIGNSDASESGKN